MLTLSLVFLTAASYAQDVDDAIRTEQERLQGEMQKMAGREAWEGVEGVYLELLALDGAQPTYAEHILGAQAAQNLGNVEAIRERLALAIAQWSTSFAQDWLDTIDSTYGAVVLSLEPKVEEAVLTPASEPFAQERRHAIEFAQASLRAQGQFTGYLPVGTYTLAGERFTVTAGESVEVQAGGAAGVVIAVRVRAGLGYAAAGAATGSTIQPEAFGGPSPRLGAGVTLGRALGVGVEAGWLGALGSGTDSRLGMGYGLLSAELQRDRLHFSAGPMIGIGRGSAVDVDADSLQSYCDNQLPIECIGLESGTAAMGTSALHGRLLAGGGALGVGVRVLSADNIAGDVELLTSALSDSARWYPAAQLAFSLRWMPRAAPSGVSMRAQPAAQVSEAGLASASQGEEG